MCNWDSMSDLFLSTDINSHKWENTLSEALLITLLCHIANSPEEIYVKFVTTMRQKTYTRADELQNMIIVIHPRELQNMIIVLRAGKRPFTARHYFCSSLYLNVRNRLTNTLRDSPVPKKSTIRNIFVLFQTIFTFKLKKKV